MSLCIVLAAGAGFIACRNPAAPRTESSAKAITFFTVALESGSSAGAIDEAGHAIAVSVPYGTTATALVPTITHTGQGVSPASGAAQNFTNPVTYTVTAEDGTTQDYVVTVTAEAPNSDAYLSALALSAGTLTPDFGAGTTTYTAAVANSVESVTVTATARNTNATLAYSPSQTVSPAAGESATVTVTVTAEDGVTTRTYSVTVTRAASSSKAITAFRFESLDVTAVINQTAHTIAATVPYGTSVTGLVPTVEHTGQSVSPASGAAQNFTNPVTYTVTAQDGTTQDYVVTITVASGTDLGTIAGHEQALEAVLRSIPRQYIDSARENVHVAYEHTSHGTHVAYGLYGLPEYKTGDDTLFAVTNSETAVSGALHFYDYAPISSTYNDLSSPWSAEGWATWVNENRAWLDSDSTETFNVVLWSWCNIAWVDTSLYLSAMQTLIDEYGPGGSKIGGSRATPVTFVFMTGHADSDGINTGATQPKAKAAEIIAYCRARGYYCLDYYSIDTTTPEGVYYEDTNDNGESATYVQEYNESHATDSSGSFYRDWQDAHTLGGDWFYSKDSPSAWGVPTPGAHNENPLNYITANRKAYAFWWILARLSGWGE
jgi:hypothetical protein